MFVDTVYKRSKYSLCMTGYRWVWSERMALSKSCQLFSDICIVILSYSALVLPLVQLKQAYFPESHTSRFHNHVACYH